MDAAVRKTARYALGELLRDSSTTCCCSPQRRTRATPPTSVCSCSCSTRRLRRREIHPRGDGPPRRPSTSAAPKRRWSTSPNGSRTAHGRPQKIFTKRIPHTVDFQIDGAEFELYRDVTRFVKVECARAAASGDDPRARAVGFLMALYQRRLASSTYALRRSLENRAKRLDEMLKKAQEIARPRPAGSPGPGRTGGNGGCRARAAGGPARGHHPGQ